MNTARIHAFELALGTENSAWHDYNLEIAAEAANQFSVSDWNFLRSMIIAKAVYWQERCAEAAGFAGNEQSVGLLTTLLESSHLTVAAIAASELDDMSIRLPCRLEPILQNLLQYLDEKRSPRREDVERLIRT